MPDYRRFRVPGGTYFFTINLLERRSDLLVRQIDALREAVRRTRQEWPFTIDATGSRWQRGDSDQHQLRDPGYGHPADRLDFGLARIAAFNGRNDPEHYIWGEIGEQLGQADLVRPYWIDGPRGIDEKKWTEIIGDEPTLIFLDELPPYLLNADTRPVGKGSLAAAGTLCGGVDLQTRRPPIPITSWSRSRGAMRRQS